MSNLSSEIKEYAYKLGFNVCGIAKAGQLPEEEKRLKQWLKDGRHGEMGYMANHFDKRTDPTKLFDQAKSVIVVLYNYFPDHLQPVEDNYKISKYAYGTDYHFVIKKKLKELTQFINGKAPTARARVFVDTAPVLERSWAQRAGLGWIGKNTCLITKKQGSFFFIGEIITDMALKYDEPFEPNHCGGCTRCIDACPTQALDKNGMDSRKCISYFTIEYRGQNIPEKFKGNFDDWIFGCDICQDVCPWNRFSEPHKEKEFNPSSVLLAMRIENWHELNKDTFQELFKDSPVKRTKFEGFQRNILFLKTTDDSN